MMILLAPLSDVFADALIVVLLDHSTLNEVIVRSESLLALVGQQVAIPELAPWQSRWRPN